MGDSTQVMHDIDNRLPHAGVAMLLIGVKEHSVGKLAGEPGQARCLQVPRLEVWIQGFKNV